MGQPSFGRDTRRRFAEAAWRIGRTRGFKGLTVRALANDLRVSPALLYSHFDDKAGLIAELQRFGHPLLVANMADALHERDGREPLLAISMAYVEFMREHGWAYEESELAILAPGLPHHQAFVESARAVMVDDTGETVGLAGVRCEHLWLGVHALGMLLAAQRSSGQRGISVAVVRAHVDVLLRGVVDVDAAVR